MTVNQIKHILRPLGILHGVNCFPDEPTSLYHCVSVKKGTATLAIDTLCLHGADAWHAHAFGPYSESINVRRNKKQSGTRTHKPSLTQSKHPTQRNRRVLSCVGCTDDCLDSE